MHLKTFVSFLYLPSLFKRWPVASVGCNFNISSLLVIVLKLNFGHCWGLRKRGQSSQGACKEEGVKSRKVKKKERKLTFESKTAGGELKPGSSGHIGTKFNTEENESIHLVKLKRGCR